MHHFHGIFYFMMFQVINVSYVVHLMFCHLTWKKKSNTFLPIIIPIPILCQSIPHILIIIQQVLSSMELFYLKGVWLHWNHKLSKKKKQEGENVSASEEIILMTWWILPVIIESAVCLFFNVKKIIVKLNFFVK